VYASSSGCSNNWVTGWTALFIAVLFIGGAQPSPALAVSIQAIYGRPSGASI
jgi:hypothetical protein